MASRLVPGYRVTSFPPTKEAVGFEVEELDGMTNEWIVPTGVTKIFATLIGAGGSLGSVTVTATTIYNNWNSVASTDTIRSGGYNEYPNTTLTVNGTTYTALGGTTGSSASATTTLYMDNDTSMSTSIIQTANQTFSGPYNIGSGAGGGYKVEARVTTFPSYNQARAIATQQPGSNGQTKKFEINVKPGNVVTYTTGTADGGGGGAVYITY